MLNRSRSCQLAPTVVEKMCSRCKEMLPSSEFYPHRRMKSGLQSHCRKCARAWHNERPDYVRAKNAEYKAKNPTYQTDRNRYVKYGLTRADIDEIIKAQGGKCAGCLRDVSNIKWCVDHCHKSGRVRGVLCDDCNLSIGRLRDEVATLYRLAAYLLQAEAEAHS